MRFKKLLAAVIAAAMFTATVPLSLAVSASSLEIGSEDENKDDGENETGDEETEDEETEDEVETDDNILHWTLTAKSQSTITVVPGKSEGESGSGSGGGTVSPEEPPYDVHIVNFDTGDIEAEVMPYHLVYYIKHNSQYYGASAEITNKNGSYSFICAVPIDIAEEGNYTVTAYLTLGNTVAELDVDTTSTEVQSFTDENCQPVKFVGNSSGATGGITLAIQIDSYHYLLGSWDITKLDTVYLPIQDGFYEYYIGLYSEESGINYFSTNYDFTVGEGGKTINYVIPDAEFITVNLDTSELPVYKNIYGDSWNSVYDDNGSYMGDFGQNAKIYNEAFSALKDYYQANVNVYFDDYTNIGIEYRLADSLKDGDTVKLGTEFTAELYVGWSGWRDANHPGDNILIDSWNITDKYGNWRIVLRAHSIPVTITFTNVDDPDDVYTVETTIKYINNQFEITLPEGMDGTYNVELFAEYSVDVTGEPETPIDPPEEPEDPTPSVPSYPSNPGTPSTSENTAEPEETVQPAVELKDGATGVTVTSEDGTALPEGVVLQVEMGTTTVVYTDHIYVLDITLVDENGEKIQPNGPVTVTIPVPKDWYGEYNYYIYYEAEDGTLTYIQSTYKDGYVTFITDHFSKYILTTEKLLLDDEGKVIPETPDAAPAPSATAAPDAENGGAAGGTDEDKNMNTGVFLAVIPMIAAAAGAVITKKRK